MTGGGEGAVACRKSTLRERPFAENSKAQYRGVVTSAIDVAEDGRMGLGFDASTRKQARN